MAGYGYGYGYGGRPFDYSRPTPQPNPPRIMRGPPAPQYYAAPPQISYGMDPYQPSPLAGRIPMNYNGPSVDGPSYRITPDIQQNLLRNGNPGNAQFKPGDVYVVREVKPCATPTYYAQPSSQPVRVVHDPYYGY